MQYLGSVMELFADNLKTELANSIFSSNIIFKSVLNSTNMLGKELASQGAPEGTFILANEQTAGRGRMKRVWHSPSGKNLLFSIILRPPDITPSRVFAMTMLLALATVEAILINTGLKAGIKWPNDIYFNNKKLGGILSEFSVFGKKVDYLVLGLGLNVLWYPEDHNMVLAEATSITKEIGKNVSRKTILLKILNVFNDYYSQVISGDWAKFYELWNNQSIILGRRVEIRDNHGSRIYGKAIRIEQDGSLILQDKAQRELKILTGDVSLRLKK